jgi:putative aldouronate transport system permease protein
MRGKTTEDRIVDTVNYILLTIIGITAFYPFYYLLIISFNEGMDTTYGGIYLWPRSFTLSNYTYFFNDPKWIQAILITVLRTLTGTALSLFFTCLVAYGLAQKKLLFQNVYFVLIIIAMNFSGGLIAYYVVLKGIGLLNTFGVYVIPTMLSLFFLIIAVSFFREIPTEIGESARIDGASEFKIFLRIVLPVSMPLLASMCLFLGSGQWNSWLDSAYFVQNESLRTLAYRMMQVVNQATMPTDAAGSAEAMSQLKVTSFSVQVTAMIISIFPIVCVYPFLQKYFVKGMMLGSVKG